MSDTSDFTDRILSTDSGLELRAKTALRMQYAAEIKIFKQQQGGLEDIRRKLGFSRRKMCQLLLVDPSAWTRWCKDESKTPPHVYRSLEWFLALNEKALTQPDLASIFAHRYKAPSFLNSEPAFLANQEIQRLKRDLQTQKWIVWSLAVAFALSLIAIVIKMGWL